jgi:predicted deacetylase
MYFSSDAEIDRLANGFVDRSLSKSEWTHAAYFAAAAWLMSSETYDAFRDMPGMIRAYNESTGTPNTDNEGYHETITQASLRATRYFLRHCASGCPLFERINRLLKSELGNMLVPRACFLLRR